MGLGDVVKNAVEVARSLQGKSYGSPPDGEGPWEGPDDLWPPDDPETPAVEPEPVPDATPDILITKQWGLVLPDGQVQWGNFLGVVFDNPMDRLRMIATLQNLATQLGYAADLFISGYSWVTRNQIAAVVYEAAESYTLTDPVVSAVPTQEGES